MGARIDEIASREDLYASTLIREIVEVHVIEQERRARSHEDEIRNTNEDKLRGELIALNEELMALLGRRDTVRLRLKRASEEDHEDDAPESDEMSFEDSFEQELAQQEES